MIRDRIEQISSEIADACRQCGRNPEEITLVGVTKFASQEAVKEALEAGLVDIGENKVKEAQKKFKSLPAGVVKKHMIGHLQTNKVKAALELFDLIQSVDSIKLAETIEQQAAKLNRQVDILLQVNTSGETQKHGFAPGQVQAAVEQISQYSHILILGLMTIAPLGQDEDIIRRCFKDLKNIDRDIAGRYGDSERVQMKYLSMGMTDDYRVAIEEGSNMVRIGRAIFQPPG